MNGGVPSPFSPRTVLGLLLFGAAAFVLTLYFLGIGATDWNHNDGGGHAGGKGLNGYAALAQLMERRGWQVERSRTPAGLDSPGLVILTPPHEAEGAEIGRIVERRALYGPTLVVLPKWTAMQLPPGQGKAKRGWVALGQPRSPEWKGYADQLQLRIAPARGWRAGPLEGRLPQPAATQSANADAMLVPLVLSDDGRILASALTGDNRRGEYPLIVVFEPDLLDNYGLGRVENARLADRLLRMAAGDSGRKVIFDLTLNGLGRPTNLLTLAFTPPFMAATLCLLMGAIAVAWRAFNRFGPPLAEKRAIAFGKSQLVRNSAGLIRRTGRLHLLGPPYAALMRARIAAALGLKPQAAGNDAETAIDRALAARLGRDAAFTEPAQRLRAARSVHDMLRAAGALRNIERMLDR